MNIRRIHVSWMALVFLATAATAWAREGQQAPAPSYAFLDMAGDITPVGDITMNLSVRPAPERWKLLKERYNTPQMLFRDLLSHHSTMETEFPKQVTFDEKNLRIRSSMVLRGYARNEGDGEWFVDLDLDAQQKIKEYGRTDENGRTTLRWVLTQSGDGVVFEIAVRVRLPENTTNVRVDEQNAVFRYTLKHPAGEGRPRLDTGLRVKSHIMSGAYKVYGMSDVLPEQWLARAVLKNTGPSVVKRLRVRFRIPGYAEWGLWTKLPEVVPGQTVVVPFHPVLDAKVAQLQSKAPINVMYEWRYEDKDGKQYEDTDGARATLMGGHEFFFTNYKIGEFDTNNFYELMTENSDLLAAWVSREDAVVDEFAAMANRIAGGSPSHTSPQATILTLHGIYELWVRNDFVYLSPPGMVDQSVSFDPKHMQNIKYPRDVIRDKAGTCVDLAITYAAMAASQGIDSYLALVPGHCFPVFLLPQARGEQGRRWFPIEATGIKGGLGPGYRSWAHVIQKGEEQLKRVFAGQMPGQLIPIKQLWSKGITGPELPPLPADIIKRWGLSEGSGAILTAGKGQQQPQQQPQPQQAGAALIGTWEGQQVFHTPNGQIPAVLRIVIGRLQNGALGFEGGSVMDLADGQGGTQRMISTATGTVAVKGNRVVFNILKGQTKNMSTGQVVQEQPDTVTLTVQGTQMFGTEQNDGGITVKFALRKTK